MPLNSIFRLASVLPERLLRRLGRWQWAGALPRWLVRRAASSLRSRDVVIPRGEAAGLRFNAAGANAGYALGTTEPLVQRALVELLLPGDVLYDLGANVGFFTVIAARRVGPSGGVLAFEPLPENAAALRRNVASNGFGNVRVIEAAVGAAPGTAALERTQDQTWARIAPPGAAGVRTPVVTLDGILAEGGRPPAVVKIDVEGAEVDVLTGMADTLARWRPIIVAEMHGRNREVAARLRAAGYVLRTLEAEVPLEDARWDVHVLAEHPAGPTARSPSGR